MVQILAEAKTIELTQESSGYNVKQKSDENKEKCQLGDY